MSSELSPQDRERLKTGECRDDQHVPVSSQHQAGVLRMASCRSRPDNRAWSARPTPCALFQRARTWVACRPMAPPATYTSAHSRSARRATCWSSTHAAKPAAAPAATCLIGRLKARGCAGIVTDGGFRDTPDIALLDFPAYHAAGTRPELWSVSSNRAQRPDRLLRCRSLSWRHHRRRRGRHCRYSRGADEPHCGRGIRPCTIRLRPKRSRAAGA